MSLGILVSDVVTVEPLWQIKHCRAAFSAIFKGCVEGASAIKIQRM